MGTYLLPALAVITSLLAYWAFNLVRQQTYTKIPTLGPRRTLLERLTNSFLAFDPAWGVAGCSMFQKHEACSKDHAFRVPAAYGYSIVLPRELLQEYSRMGPDMVDFMAAPRDHMFFKYTVTMVANESDYHARVVKTLLNQHLAAISDCAINQISTGLDIACGNSKEWKTQSLAGIVISTTARSASSFLVGEPLCQQEEYIQICIEYAMQMEIAAGKIRTLPPILRPFLGPYYCRRLAELRQAAERFLKPLIEEQVKKSGIPSAIEWLSVALRGTAEGELKRQVARIMFLNVISIFTVSMATLNVLYDILARPDVKKAVLDEIAVVWDASSSSLLKVVLLDKLRKLDSCIRESQRLNPTNWLILEGKALQDIHFSNGLSVKAGSNLSIPGGVILESNGALSSPGSLVSTREYDAFRFADVDSTKANTNLATSISPGNITFGYGRMSCPGRYFAVHLIKALIVDLLIRYDAKLASVGGGGEVCRPQNIRVGNVIIPDPNVNLKYRLK